METQLLYDGIDITENKQLVSLVDQKLAEHYAQCHQYLQLISDHLFERHLMRLRNYQLLILICDLQRNSTLIELPMSLHSFLFKPAQYRNQDPIDLNIHPTTKSLEPLIPIG